MDYPAFTDIKGVLAYYLEDFKRWIMVNGKWRISSILGRNKMLLDPLRKLKGSKKGHEALIFANGPSVAKLTAGDYLALKVSGRTDFFGLNYFVSSELCKEVGLDYYVTSDPYFFSPRNPKIDQILDEVNIHVRKGVFVGHNSHQETIATVKKMGKNVVRFNDRNGSSVFSDNINPEHPRAYVSLTAYKALALAVYMGYDKIYLTGFDNSFFKNLFCDPDNVLYRLPEHFDSKAYYFDGTRVPLFNKDRRMHQEMIGSSRIFSDLYKFPGTHIFNLDPESYTDRFKKLDIRSLTN